MCRLPSFLVALLVISTGCGKRSTNPPPDDCPSLPGVSVFASQGELSAAPAGWNVTLHFEVPPHAVMNHLDVIALRPRGAAETGASFNTGGRTSPDGMSYTADVGSMPASGTCVYFGELRETMRPVGRLP